MQSKPNPRSPLLGPVVVAGFSAAVAVWCAWFITHLPWIAISEQLALPIILGVWTLTLTAILSLTERGRAIPAGIGAGALSAAIGLLLLGSKLAPAGSTASAPSGVQPGAILIAGGFLVLGTVVGAAAGVLAHLSGRSSPDQSRATWLFRLALVDCVAIAPLLFVGGLVTSTNSGMAVPDWPNTFGSNMFLYPIGPRIQATMGEPYKQVFLEHAHRLFGTLVGLATLALMIFTLRWDHRRAVRILAVIAFAIVVVQGVLGGLRVIQDLRLLAMVHGVLAQLVFGCVVALAVVLSPAFRALPPDASTLLGPAARRIKMLCTATLHTLILQLIFGALYRHYRGNHALWTHAGFSVVVLIFALAAGFILLADPVRRLSAAPTLRRLGSALVAVVVLQFTLGWVAFVWGGRTLEADSVPQALIRTAHQANGALLLAVAAAAFVWGKRLARPSNQAGPVPSPVA